MKSDRANGKSAVDRELNRLAWMTPEDYAAERARTARAPEARSLVRFTRADLIEPAPTNWLIEGWLVRDSLVGIVGQSGSCKSFLAIDLACRVATGMPWQGCKVQQGQVFLLAGEGRSGLRKRIRAWEIYTGITIADAPLYIADGLPGLTDDSNTAAVIQAITDVADAGFFQSGADPALVIIDTLARAMSGADENSAGDMGRFVRAMDWIRQTWGATVMALHHTGHGDGTQDRGRGSSAFRAALDSEFVLKADGNSLTVRATKAKDWEPPDQLTLKKVQIDVGQGVGQPETSLVLTDSIDGGTEKERRGKVFRLHQEGLKVREIAEETGIPKSTVHRWING